MMRPSSPLSFTLLLLTTLLGEGCKERAVPEDVREHIKELCVDFCPKRIDCVDDNSFDGDLDACVRSCTEYKLYDRGGKCTDYLVSRLECLAALTCEDLPAAALESERDSDDYPCSEYNEAFNEFCP